MDFQLPPVGEGLYAFERARCRSHILGCLIRRQRERQLGIVHRPIVQADIDDSKNAREASS